MWSKRQMQHAAVKKYERVQRVRVRVSAHTLDAGMQMVLCLARRDAAA